jgi:hypothetical protein
VVWVVFNTVIALLLMELEVFQALGQVLALYSNIAISWIMTVVADLLINKPLGLPARHRVPPAYLYDINPVGLGAMTLASCWRWRPIWGPWARWRRRCPRWWPCARCCSRHCLPG